MPQQVTHNRAIEEVLQPSTAGEARELLIILGAGVFSDELYKAPYSRHF